MRDAAACGGVTQIEAHVETIGSEGGGQDAFCEDDLIEQVGPFVGVQILEVHDLPEGHRQQMAGVVGEPVQDEVGLARTMHDKRGTVVTEGRQFRERPSHLRRILWRLDVFHAPVGMQVLHRKGGACGGGGLVIEGWGAQLAPTGVSKPLSASPPAVP